METTHAPHAVGGSLRVALRPLTTWRGGTTLLHNLLGLLLGIAYFIWFLTGFSTGLGLAITLIGIPILTLVLASVRPLAAVERQLANGLLGADIPDAPLTPGGEGVLGRFKAYWADRRTWRGLTYLVLRFPVGLATFTAAVTAFGVAATLIAAPLIVPSDADAWDFGTWHVDTVGEAFALVPLGLLALVAAGWISEGLGRASRELARWGTR